MKIKFVPVSMQTYTGPFGLVTFVNGVSVEDVSQQQASRIASNYPCEWENGTPVSNAAQAYQDTLNTPAPSIQVEVAPKTPAKPVVKATVAPLEFTEQSLGAIADEQGIAGLRTIAERFGVKGTAIRVLIDGILKAQAVAK